MGCIMSYTNLIDALRVMKLHGMADYLIDYSETKQSKNITKENWLEYLIKAEKSDRATRTIRYQMSTAKFPIQRILDLCNSCVRVTIRMVDV